MAAFTSMVAAMILAAPCGHHDGLLYAAERPNSQQQTGRQQSQTESKAPASTTTFSVGGVAHTAEGAPVPGATVRFTNTDTNQIWVSWTDPSGKFEFPALPAGPYRAETSQLGFVSSSLEVRLGAGPAAPSMQFVLRVVTLAQLAAPAGNEKAPQPANAAGRRSNRNAITGNGPTSNAGSTAPGGRAGYRGRGQLPPGVLNAVTQGLAAGGFQQTDLADESTGDNEEAGPPPTEMPSGGAGLSSDAFLLQGTVGMGLSPASPGGRGAAGGFGAFGPGGIDADLPGVGTPGGPAGGVGGRGGPGLGAVQGGGTAVFFARGAGGGGLRGGGGGGRLFRQAVNRVRFSFYDRYENSAFDAKPYSLTGNQFPKISHYNERFGGNIGGPLAIPHIYNGKDRTYFFANYQHDTEQSPINTFSTVPTLDERQGIFCGTTLYEPFSSPGTPFPSVSPGCQQVPVSAISQALLAYIPTPNVPCTATGCPVTRNYLLQATTPSNTDSVNVHVLHTLNAKFNLNGGYNFNSVRENTLSNFLDTAGRESTRNQGFNLSLAHNWSPRFVENTSISWTRSRAQILSDNSFINNIAGNLGINGIATTPIDYGLPLVQFTNFSSLNDPVPSLVRNQTLRFDDSLTWVHAKHTMRFGGEVRRIQLNNNSNPIPRGQFTFTGLVTAQEGSNGFPLEGTGNDFADFLLGFPYNTRVQFGNPSTHFRSWGFALYAQDDFRFSKTFTIQYGIRYDAVTPPVELANQIANLDLNSSATAVAFVTPGSPGTLNGVTIPGDIGPFHGTYPRALIHGDYRNWAPRIGFAWQPGIKPKTVIRGGFSIFYDTSIYNTLAQRYLAYQPPFDVSHTVLTTPQQPLTLSDGLLVNGQSSSTISNTGSIDPFYRDPYAQIWTLGTETSFSQNWILDLTYTGTKGTDLETLRSPNRAPLGTPPNQTQLDLQIPNATSFYFLQSNANSIYNALQVRLMHRFTHGFMMQGIYTWGKSLDDAGSLGGTSATVQQQDGNIHAEYGLSSFDVRDQFRLLSVYQFPFGERNRHANHGWTRNIFGDWRFQNVFTWQTGTPYTVLVGGAATDNGTGANFSLRADQVGNPDVGICGGSKAQFFNTSAFVAPPAFAYGNEHRGAIEGPCTISWNMSLAKTFRFGPEQRHRVDARWEVQNLTNTVNYSGVGASLGSRYFGEVTSASAMRTMYIMIRFNF